LQARLKGCVFLYLSGIGLISRRLHFAASWIALGVRRALSTKNAPRQICA
jgi:hypothetical protein